MSVSPVPQKQYSHNIACFSLTTDIDPGTLPRVLELFAKRGLTPLKCHASQTYAHETMTDDLHQMIDIQMAEMNPTLADKIGASLRTTYGVHSVLLSTKASIF